MNTKPRIRRYDTTKIVLQNQPDGASQGTIADPEIGNLVAQIIATFVHLEAMMAFPLAALAGTDRATAGYILRAIKSPRGRVDLMRELLTKSPRNMKRDAVWDDLLSEFWRINIRRNAYVHGYWWSHVDGSTWLAEQDEHGVSFLVARSIEASELVKLRDDIGVCANMALKVAHGS